MAGEEIPRVVSVQWLGDHRLRVGFDDGSAGEVDLAARMKFRGLLAPLADPALFAQVAVDEETGMLRWPGDLEFDPVILHHYVTGRPMPKWAGPIVDSGR